MLETLTFSGTWSKTFGARPNYAQVIAKPIYGLLIAYCIFLCTASVQTIPQTIYGVRSPKFFWAPVNSCIHWMRPRNSPLPSHLGSYEGAIGQTR
jgi:hypothetical protein